LNLNSNNNNSTDKLKSNHSAYNNIAATPSTQEVTTKNNNTYFSNDLLIKSENYMITAKTVVDSALTGLHASKRSGFNIEFSEYKQYNTGEDIKYIDWKLFGKTEKLYTKRFEEESIHKIFILLDTSKSMAFQSAALLSKLEYSKFVAACIIYKILNQGDAFELFAFDENINKLYQLSQSFSAINEVDKLLKNLQPDGLTNFSKVLNKLLTLPIAKSLIIIISDFFSDFQEDTQTICELLNRCRRHSAMLAIIQILDDNEINFNFNEPLEFRPLESGVSQTLQPQKIKERYIKFMQNYLDNLKHQTSAQNIIYTLMNTTHPLDINLINFLKNFSA